MANVRLVISPGSCSLASHILIRESGIKFEIVKIKEISQRQHFPEEYLHLNSKRRVPILLIDDYVITETPAIMTAIAQLSPEKKLLGKTDLEVVRAYEWLNYLSGTLHGQGFGGMLRPNRFVDDEKLYGAVVSKAQETTRGCFEYIEEKLEGKTFAVGDDFTATDAFLLVFYRWGNGGGFGMEEHYPNYTRLVLELSKRESVKDAVELEGIDMLSHG